jgi:hypothetical protein
VRGDAAQRARLPVDRHADLIHGRTPCLGSLRRAVAHVSVTPRTHLREDEHEAKTSIPTDGRAAV